MSALLELREVSFEYLVPGQGHSRLLDQLSLAVNEDEFVAVLGPTGSGKSSLVRLAAGLALPTQGTVFYRGEPLSGVHPKVGVVLQTAALFPWMSVQENIALGLEKLALSEAQRAEAVAWAVDKIGLEGYEEAYPRELSQGMKVRVALARALAAQPELLVLDDPFSGLDVLTAEALHAELLALWQASDVNPKAILLLTQNIQEAVEQANRVLVFSGTPTRLKAELHNPLSYPRDPNSEEYLGKVAQVHDLITKDIMPDEAQGAGRFESRLAPLPRAEIGQIIGLLEALADQGGRFDVFDFVAETRKEYSTVLMIVNAAEMLDLVRTPKDQVEITEMGRQFLKSDVNGRKVQMNLQLQKLRFIRHVMDMLQHTAGKWLAKETCLEQFSILFPSEQPNRLFNNLVSWARYAELFGFSERRGQLYLDHIFSMQDGQVVDIRTPRPPRAKAAPAPAAEAAPAPEMSTGEPSSPPAPLLPPGAGEGGASPISHPSPAPGGRGDSDASGGVAG